MDEYTLNSQSAEVVQPQEQENQEVAQPEDEALNRIKGMTSQEFDEYLNNLGNEEEDAEDDEAKNPDGDEAENEEVADPTAKEPTAFKTFATQEEYEADRNQAIEKAVKKRLKGSRERDELLKRITRSAKAYYSDSKDPIKAMLDDLDAQTAQDAGQSVEDYRAAQDEAEELEEFRRSKRENEQRQQNEAQIIERWHREEEDLKKDFPDFELRKAMQNPVFADMLVNGLSVAMAYIRTNKPQPKPKRREIAQNARSAVKGTGENVRNPAKFSTAEFNEYINNILGR